MRIRHGRTICDLLVTCQYGTPSQSRPSDRQRPRRAVAWTATIVDLSASRKAPRSRCRLATAAGRPVRSHRRPRPRGSLSAFANRFSFAPSSAIHSWRRRNPTSTSRLSNTARLALEHRDRRPCAARFQQLDELGQGGQRHPRLAMDRRPARVGDRRRLALHEHGDAQPPGRHLERIDERADRLDVVPDMRDQRRHRPRSPTGWRRGHRAWTVETFSMS